MPKILEFRLESDDLGLVFFSFPQTRILRGPPHPMFLADRRVIVVSDDQPFRHYADREVIQITRYAELVLDSRPGYLKFLRESCRVTITPYQRETLLDKYEVDDERFWREAKLARFNRRICGVPETAPPGGGQQTRIVNIFETLFTNFEETYRRYRLSGLHHQVVLYSLMSMMKRTTKPEGLQRTSRLYRDALVKNRAYRRRYASALLEYTDNPERKNKHISEDAAFLSFLYDCSTDEHLMERDVYG